MQELLFVYNADAGLLHGALDLLHKTFSPKTYSCSLCALTYNTLGMKPEWRRFWQALPVAKTTFLHRDELRAQHPELAGEQLPAAFVRRPGGPGWQLLLNAAEMNAAADLPELMGRVRERLG